MSITRQIILFLLIISHLSTTYAQVFGSKTDSTNRIWHIKVETDFVFNTLSGKIRDKYAGEYYQLNNQNNTYSWIWKEYDKVDKKPLNTYKISMVKYSLLLNLYKGLYAGISYNGTLLQGGPPMTYTDPVTGQVIVMPNYSVNMLMGIAGTLAYEQRFKIGKFKRLSVCPSVSYGGYTSSLLDLSDNANYFEGMGKERFYDARLALQLHAWAGWKLRTFVSYAGYSYTENYPSVVFPDKNRVVNYGLSMFTFGGGIGRTLDIYEDASERKLTYREAKKRDKKAEKQLEKEERRKARKAQEE